MEIEIDKKETLHTLYQNFKKVISEEIDNTNFFEYIFTKYNLRDDLERAKLIACFTEIDSNKFEDGSIEYGLAIKIAEKWQVKHILEAEETDRLMDIYCIDEEEKHAIS